MEDRFTIVKRGYDPEEVNKYIESLELVIRGYKEKDTAINNALISAQVAAGNILKEADDNAANIKSAAMARLKRILTTIDIQKRMIKEFQDDYNLLINRYLTEVNDDEIMSLHNAVNALEEFIIETTEGEPLPDTNTTTSSSRYPAEVFSALKAIEEEGF